MAEAFHRGGFGPAGDLWSVINGSRMLTALRAPGQSRDALADRGHPVRTGDLGVAGDQLGVETPVIDALVTLASAVLGVDCRTQGRTVEDLGLAGYAAEELTAFLEHGAG